MCCLFVLSVAASAQTVKWDLNAWWEGNREQRQAHNWVDFCDINEETADINALGTEKKSPENGDIAEWYATSNIGTPLQLILNGSVSVYKVEQVCSMSRRMALAQRFLQMGADPNDGLYHQKGNNTDRINENNTSFYKIDTPLGYAVRNGKYEIAELLLRNNADPNYTWNGFWLQQENGAYYDDNAHFALEQVVTSPLRDYRPAQRNQMIDLLVRYGADVNALDDCGRTPLARLMLCAAHSGNLCPAGFNHRDYLNIAYQLRSKGADVKAKGKAQPSCRNGMASVSARDIWKEYMSNSTRDLWEDFIKGK